MSSEVEKISQSQSRSRYSCFNPITLNQPAENQNINIKIKECIRLVHKASHKFKNGSEDSNNKEMIMNPWFYQFLKGGKKTQMKDKKKGILSLLPNSKKPKTVDYYSIKKQLENCKNNVNWKPKIVKKNQISSIEDLKTNSFYLNTDINTPTEYLTISNITESNETINRSSSLLKLNDSSSSKQLKHYETMTNKFYSPKINEDNYYITNNTEENINLSRLPNRILLTNINKDRSIDDNTLSREEKDSRNNSKIKVFSTTDVLQRISSYKKLSSLNVIKRVLRSTKNNLSYFNTNRIIKIPKLNFTQKAKGRNDNLSDLINLKSTNTDRSNLDSDRTKSIKNSVYNLKQNIKKKQHSTIYIDSDTSSVISNKFTEHKNVPTNISPKKSKDIIPKFQKFKFDKFCNEIMVDHVKIEEKIKTIQIIPLPENRNPKKNKKIKDPIDITLKSICNIDNSNKQFEGVLSSTTGITTYIDKTRADLLKMSDGLIKMNNLQMYKIGNGFINKYEEYAKAADISDENEKEYLAFNTEKIDRNHCIIKKISRSTMDSQKKALKIMKKV